MEDLLFERVKTGAEMLKSRLNMFVKTPVVR